MKNSAKLKLGLLSATMFTSTLLVTPAFAEEAGETSTEVSDEGDGMIIVTATRRATSILDTPINISAVSAEDLKAQRIDDVRDLAAFTPGVTISDTGGGSTGKIVLRSLSASDTGDFGSNYDSALGIYMGEVPLYYDFKLLDLERVETLLGPQGTLYGLGTLAGAIRYIPERPDVTGVEGNTHGRVYAKSHSDRLGYQFDGMINLPIITDYIAFRSATGYYYDPGFIDYPLLVQEAGISLPQPTDPVSIDPADYDANLFGLEDLNFERTFTTRNQLLVQADEGLKAIFTYAYQQTETDGAQSNSFGVLGTGRYENASRFVEPVDRSASLYSLEINASIADIFEVVATGAYTKTRFEGSSDVTDLLLDLDYGYELYPAFAGFTDSDQTREQTNFEVRFVSTHGGPFSWVIGGFYNENDYQSDYNERIPNHPWVDPVTNPDALEYVSYITSEVKEKAVFGEVTFEITPQWQFTAGGRYFDYSSTIAGAAALPVLGDPLSPYDLPVNGGAASDDGFVWKFNTSYNITPDLIAYLTYSKGYRIGGPNRVAPCPDNVADGDQIICALPSELQYGPDTTKNWEFGMRGNLFDDKLSFNFNIFHIDWSGIQVASSTLFGATGITVNGGTAKSKGFDVGFQLRPVTGLTIQGTYSYNDAYLTEDVPEIITVRAVPGDYTARPKRIQLDALSGDRLPGSAQNSGALGVTYTMPVGMNDLTLNWTTTYRGNVVSRLGWERAYGDKIPSFVLHNMAVTYDMENWSLSLFANNVFDKFAISSVANDRSQIGVNDGITVRYYRQAVINPRTVGVEARMSF